MARDDLGLRCLRVYWAGGDGGQGEVAVADGTSFGFEVSEELASAGLTELRGDHFPAGDDVLYF